MQNKVIYDYRQNYYSSTNYIINTNVIFSGKQACCFNFGKGC